MIIYKTNTGKVHQRGEVFTGGQTVRTLTATDYKEVMRVAIPIDDVHGVKVNIKSANSKGYETAECGDPINISFPNSDTRRGRVRKQVAQTIQTSCNQGVLADADSDGVESIYYPQEDCYIAIRKLTPKEYFRLQGWTDDYYEKAQFVNSNSQLYKQAGNGVTVNVIQAIASKF